MNPPQITFSDARPTIEDQEERTRLIEFMALTPTQKFRLLMKMIETLRMLDKSRGVQPEN